MAEYHGYICDECSFGPFLGDDLTTMEIVYSGAIEGKATSHLCPSCSSQVDPGSLEPVRKARRTQRKARESPPSPDDGEGVSSL